MLTFSACSAAAAEDAAPEDVGLAFDVAFGSITNFDASNLDNC
jgi:hypothetical protein